MLGGRSVIVTDLLWWYQLKRKWSIISMPCLPLFNTCTRNFSSAFCTQSCTSICALPKSFKYKFAGTVTAGQCMCCRENFTHWFSNFHSYYMKRDESCLVANSPSESKFSESICCQKMVEMHGYNEHVSVTGEDDSPCHATLSDNMNSVRNYSDVSLFMVSVKVWVLEHFSILYRLCGCWCFIAYYLTQDDEKIIRMCCEVVHYVSLYELFHLSLFAADGQKLSIYLGNLLSNAMLLNKTGFFWVPVAPVWMYEFNVWIEDEVNVRSIFGHSEDHAQELIAQFPKVLIEDVFSFQTLAITSTMCLVHISFWQRMDLLNLGSERELATRHDSSLFM